MKETLLERVKYLLSFKLNTEDSTYTLLIETLFFEFLESVERHYRKDDISSSTFYNTLLDKINRNIKSIIIPALNFCYHPSGFLEFRVHLKDEILKYKNENISISKDMKEGILKKKYYSYMLEALKNHGNGIGFCQKGDKSFLYFEKALNEWQALELANMCKLYKKEYKTMYPDGTSYHYFLYTKDLASDSILCLNAIQMVEVLLGKKNLFQGELDGDLQVLKKFDDDYEHLLGNLQYDKFGHSIYTATTIVNEFLKRIYHDDSVYKKLEYFKKLNQFLLEIFNYKVTSLLNLKKDIEIDMLLQDLKVFESNMLYNVNYELNASMEHIKIFQNIKTKLYNYQKQDKVQVEKEYAIESLDRKKHDVVTSSVQPIQVGNQYVVVHILDLRSMNSRILIKADFRVIDMGGLATRIYSGIYLSVKELKFLYSSSDLGFSMREAEVIREAIANRLVNPTIMDIIKTERNCFLGEFVYSKEEDRAIIYKNKSIENVLE